MGFELPKINLKKPVYEVILPTVNTTAKVSGLSNSDILTVTQSSMTTTLESMNLITNIIFMKIQDKEIFKNDFDFFISHIDFDNDFISLLIGTLVETHGLEKHFNFEIACSNCGEEVPFKIPYNKIVTDIQINPEKKAFHVYEEEMTLTLEDYGIEFTLRNPSIKDHLIITSLIEQIESARKVFDILKIPEVMKSSILLHVAYAKYIKRVKSLETQEVLDIDFNTQEQNDDFLVKLVYFGKLIGELPTDFFESILPRKLITNKYYISCEHKKKCPKCKTVNSVDVKPLLLQAVFP